MKGIQIKPLLVSDADSIPALTKTGVRRDVFPLTIYSSPNYNLFVQNTILDNSDTKFFGAYLEGRFLGFAEWRTHKDELFLNNIAIQEGEKGLGVGGLLYKYGLSTLKTPYMKALALDVFHDNKGARSWYEKLGYKVHDITYWHVAQQLVKSTSENVTYQVINREQADEHHQKYGFSMLTIQTKQGHYSIGRITNYCFRMDVKGIVDQDLMGALYELDKNRKLLTLNKKPNVEGFKQVCTSLRMKMSLTHQRGGIYGYQNT
ncbi:GNAT family N-acetyltransferase [Guptibacillus hwajinpoensis]|uniref:GNAT superfamily N-acetyltransferase n=1 Tax=Guptibacillus hwajinpoensis TaxID=208199 RepID=A0ABU0JZK3_9BACL|nr:GNAT family N-acetyltransferase [Alkalihalobacillus hemicentroti]MDQ0482527.1 GNAT superfamily N-acetyltransferase [Alkalihalobacillus hemicentroti]